MRRLVIVVAVLVSACGGGGTPASVLFAVAGTVPGDGDVGAPTDSPITVTFTLPADLDTVTESTVRLVRADGSPVGAQLIKQNFNTTTVRLQPLTTLDQNSQYRLIVSGTIRSVDGSTTIGADRVACFITLSTTPTIRPDQLIDLGDALNEPRFEARSLRTTDGRFFVLGGFTDDQTATDTIEEWLPDERRFVVVGQMRVPRAQHTITPMAGGVVLIAGGVSSPGGPPLRSTEIYTPGGGSSDGPDMNVARTYHAASRHFGGGSVMVSGGFDAAGNELDSVEYLENNQWVPTANPLPVPSARHLQFDYDFDKVYFSVGNLEGKSAYYNGSQILPKQEGDIRFRTAAVRISADRVFMVGGDTRSAVTYDFTSNVTWGATDFLFERRGGHTMTARGAALRYLVAGGFNIAQTTEITALKTLEIVDFLDPGQFGLPDAQFYRVVGIELPVPFAGHIAFEQIDGTTVLAGGWGGETGPHSRRAVMILSDFASPPVHCGN